MVSPCEIAEKPSSECRWCSTILWLVWGIWGWITERKEPLVKTLTAIYKGDRILELTESLELAENTVVLVVIPEQSDEAEMRQHLAGAAQTVFAKLWNNEEDEVWNEYL